MKNYVDYDVIMDFVSCYRGSNLTISDCIGEYADSHTSIYHGDIMYFIQNNVDYMDDIINGYGWDACGGSLEKAGQYAEFCMIDNELHDCIEEIIARAIEESVDSCYDGDNSQDIVEDIMDNYATDFDCASRFCDIDSFVADAVHNITAA